MTTKRFRPIKYDRVDSFHGLVLAACSHLAADWDLVNLVTGAERTGKSAFSFTWGAITDYLHFDLNRIAFTSDQLVTLQSDPSQTPPGAWVSLDEGITGAMSWAAMSKPNRQIKEWLTVSGERNLNTCILIPNKRYADGFLDKHRAHLWWHVYERGHVLPHVPSRSPYSEKVFWKPLRPIPFPDPRDHPALRPLWMHYLQLKRDFTADQGEGTTPQAPRDQPTGPAIHEYARTIADELTPFAQEARLYDGRDLSAKERRLLGFS